MEVPDFTVVFVTVDYVSAISAGFALSVFGWWAMFAFTATLKGFSAVADAA